MKKTKPYFLHPFEMAFCGYSGSGKTTLIKGLVENFKTLHKVAYLKHDAHEFEMDRQGKDTQVIYASGAESVFINDSKHVAHISRGSENVFELQTKLLNYDLLFIEGFKDSVAKKIIVLDKDLKILESIKSNKLQNIYALVGESASAPEGFKEFKYYNRDNIDQLTEDIKCYFYSLVPQKLNGLVLTGGKSTRMKKDKAQLIYNSGLTQAEHAFNQLSDYCDNVFISSRQGQWQGSDINNLPQIHDSFMDMGPMGGILSAQQHTKDAAWLVVACDLPYLEDQTLQDLIRLRSPFKFATCYESSSDGLPEPLCAIYEPKSFGKLLEFFALGYKCPRKVLINSQVRKLPLTNKSALQNINHPEEYAEALKELGER